MSTVIFFINVDRSITQNKLSKIHLIDPHIRGSASSPYSREKQKTKCVNERGVTLNNVLPSLLHVEVETQRFACLLQPKRRLRIWNQSNSLSLINVKLRFDVYFNYNLKFYFVLIIILRFLINFDYAIEPNAIQIFNSRRWRGVLFCTYWHQIIQSWWVTLDTNLKLPK